LALEENSKPGLLKANAPRNDGLWGSPERGLFYSIQKDVGKGMDAAQRNLGPRYDGLSGGQGFLYYEINIF